MSAKRWKHILGIVILSPILALPALMWGIIALIVLIVWTPICLAFDGRFPWEHPNP